MLSRRRVLPAAILAGALVLAACGEGSSGSDSATSGPAASDAPPATAAPDAETDADVDAQADAPDESVATEPPAELPATTVIDAVDDETETATDADEPAPEPEPAVAPAEIGGRAFATDVQPAADFDGNPFPDLVVDDVGRASEANIRNILPSDRPVLLWTWAPH